MATPSDQPNSPSPEFKDLSEEKDEGLTFGAVLGATIGNMLEFYDFVTYSFFATQIGHAFFPTKSEFGSLLLSLATFGAGFVTRPIGAIVIGSYSDRAGRRPAMLLSFAMMGVAILVLAITPSYNTIGVAAPIVVILARLTQGFSLGGEVGPTTAYLMEAAPVERRGLVVSLQPVSQQIAATAGALVGEILSLTMASDTLDTYGWRIAFLLGAGTLPFGLWLRRRLPETLHRIETPAIAVENNAAAKTLRGNTRLLGLGLVILASGTIITYVAQYMTTYAQHTLHVDAPLAFATTAVSQWCRNCCRAPGRLACRPGGPLADHGMAADRSTFADLSGFPVGRGKPQFDGAPRRSRSVGPDRLDPLQRVLCWHWSKVCPRTSAAALLQPSTRLRSRYSVAPRNSLSPG